MSRSKIKTTPKPKKQKTPTVSPKDALKHQCQKRRLHKKLILVKVVNTLITSGELDISRSDDYIYLNALARRGGVSYHSLRTAIDMWAAIYAETEIQKGIENDSEV